jgi:hypothetical protein
VDNAAVNMGIQVLLLKPDLHSFRQIPRDHIAVSYDRKLKLDPCLSSRIRINSKWIKDHNAKPETLKLVQERAWNTLDLIDMHSDFLNRTQMAQQLRERIGKCYYMQLKNFCTPKEMVTRLKFQPAEWEKIFASNTSDKESVTRKYRAQKPKLSPNQ